MIDQIFRIVIANEKSLKYLISLCMKNHGQSIELENFDINSYFFVLFREKINIITSSFLIN